ncbi:MAG: DUF2721 domain-containing protein [Sphingomonas sp.]|uniref:DUF2721 domain-containing protein n=1 Tax=Sphingomonas sp. TaxID=28214 RepID=UPI003F3CFF67
MFHLADILRAIGPNAAIVFASWIFMGFLQQRFDAAVARYRESVELYRRGGQPADRRGLLKRQLLDYRKRCLLMAQATTVGVLAAILLIITLILGAIDVIWPHIDALAVLGAACAIGGFALIILAAGIVIAEGNVSRRQIDSEVEDVPDLRDGKA